MQKKIFIVFLLLLPLLNFGQELEPKPDQILTFEEVAQPPLAKACKRKKTVDEQRACTATYINMFVNRNFNTRMAAKLVKGVVKMEAQFIIDTEGKVIEIYASGGPEKLNRHLEEILSSLNNFQPAMQDGKAVEVLYILPVSMGFY
ncbi:MAG: hypothetical protein WBL27_08525 [Salinimicrobium sp.]